MKLFVNHQRAALPKQLHVRSDHIFSSNTVFRNQPQRKIQVARQASNQGKDVLEGAVEGWLDVASFVSGGSGNKTPYADLAYKIGSDVYADISGWHLYLRDLNAAPGVKMADALAHELGNVWALEGGEQVACCRARTLLSPSTTQLVADRGYSEAAITEVLSRVPVTLGKGKVQLPLIDLIPSSSLRDLYRAVEDYERSR